MFKVVVKPEAPPCCWFDACKQVIAIVAAAGQMGPEDKNILDRSFNVCVSDPFSWAGLCTVTPGCCVYGSLPLKKFSVLFWIDTALPSHPHFQLLQTAFHLHRLYRAPPLYSMFQPLKAEPPWPETPSPPFHLSQPRIQTLQSTPPHSRSLNHWQLPPHRQQQPQDSLWPRLQAGTQLGQHTRRSHLNLMLEMKVRGWAGEWVLF